MRERESSSSAFRMALLPSHGLVPSYRGELVQCVVEGDNEDEGTTSHTIHGVVSRPPAMSSTADASRAVLKAELKTFEASFKQEHGREPTKADIKLLPIFGTSSLVPCSRFSADRTRESSAEVQGV